MMSSSTTTPAAPTSSHPGSSSAPSPAADRAGAWSRALGVLAFLGATIPAIVIGATMGPMEAAHGYHLGDTPQSYQVTVLVLGVVSVLAGILGIFALVCGILSLVRRGSNGRAIWGIVLAVLAPIAAVLGLIVSMMLGAVLA